MLKITRTFHRALQTFSARNSIIKRAFGYLNFNNVDNSQIGRFLKDNGLEAKLRSNGGIVSKTCPLCPKPHNNVSSNLWTLNFKENNGAFLCFRCGTSGSWTEFVKLMTVGQTESGPDSFHHPAKETVPLEKVKQFHEERVVNLVTAQERLAQEADLSGLQEKDLHEMKMAHYLTDPEHGRGLTFDVLSKYEVGLSQEMFKNNLGEYELIDVVCFPHFGKDKNNLAASFQVTKVKIRGLSKKDKQYMRIHPSRAQFGVFGLNLLSANGPNDSVVITEGEFDAMSVYQATGIPAISLPYGASNLPPEMINYLRDVKHIVLWMDFDEVGQLNVQTFSDKLGSSRTSIVKDIPNDQIEEILKKSLPTNATDEQKSRLEEKIKALATNKIKDANDALKISPLLIKEYIQRSKSIPQQNIIKFSQLRDLVKERIFHQDRFRGVTSHYFSWFNSLMKGFRRGE